MPTATWRVTVNRKPEEVFAYLADIKRHHEWSPKPWRAENLPDGPVQKGTTFTSFGYIPRDKEHRNEVEVTEFDPPSGLTLVSTERGQEFVNRFVLASDNGGTRLERHMELPKPPGVAGAMFPVLMALFLRPAIQKGMNMFKERCEAEGSPSTT